MDNGGNIDEGSSYDDRVLDEQGEFRDGLYVIGRKRQLNFRSCRLGVKSRRTGCNCARPFPARSTVEQILEDSV